MERRTVLRAAAATVAVPWLVRARAQTRARRIGVLYPRADPGNPPPGAAEAWKKVGWIESETLLIERRYAAWHMDRMPDLVEELLKRQRVELLVAYGPWAAAAAARATRTVPIVFLWALLPIECGLIDSYARPGRNCTGIAFSAGFEVYAKRLEIIRAIAPSARRLALLSGDTRQFTVSGEPIDAMWSEVAAAAKAQGFEHTIHMVNRIEDIGPALAEAAGARAQAANIAGDWFVSSASQVVDFALRQRWLTSTIHPELFDAGLLLYHGPSEADGIYGTGRMQQMVDRILRGANPADIPVEIPSRFEFALNLKTARALGLTLPPSVQLRADRVVE